MRPREHFFVGSPPALVLFDASAALTQHDPLHGAFRALKGNRIRLITVLQRVRRPSDNVESGFI